jgi:uncharacterized protein (TIGR02466 family)
MNREYETFNLFPIPVARVATDLPDGEITKFTYEFLGKHKLGYTTYHYSDMNKIYQRDMPASGQFVEIITEAANTFMDNWNIKTDRKPKVYFWGSHYQRGDSHDSHIHSMSTLSGTYWPIAEDRVSPIVFQNPSYSSMMQYPPTQEHYQYLHTPKTGEMLIWPSWLQHKVPTQNNDAMRVAVSFNVTYKFL